MEWTNLGVSESTEEEEGEMSGLISCFAARMRKRATNAQGLTAPSAEVTGGKHLKLTDLDEEAHKSPTVINVDSPDQASNA